MKIKKDLYLGLMTGTSLDAIDLVLAQFSLKNKGETIISANFPFPQHLKKILYQIAENKAIEIKTYANLDAELGETYAKAINNFLKQHKIKSKKIRAIGSHGQTIYHAPTATYPFSLQIGDPQRIACRTGIDTIADFRRKDIALGGQGAPLVPLFHQKFLQSTEENRIVLNIGGIANISHLPINGNIKGYDTGPGNMLLDRLIQDETGNPYDKDAKISKQGKVLQNSLKKMLQDPYFHLTPPKSTGREYFNRIWLKKYLEEKSTLEDKARTLVELSAQSIANAIKNHQSDTQKNRLILCGGGAHNPLLYQRIKALLPEWTLNLSDDFAIDSNALEAFAFAWLAYCHCENITLDYRMITGSKRPAKLGVYYSAQ